MIPFNLEQSPMTPFCRGPLRNNSTTQNGLRTASGALMTIAILLGPIRIQQHSSVKLKSHWELSYSHVKIIYHILKMYFVKKMLVFNYHFFLLNMLIWYTRNWNKDSFEIRMEWVQRKCQQFYSRVFLEAEKLQKHRWLKFCWTPCKTKKKRDKLCLVYVGLICHSSLLEYQISC